MSGVFSGIAGIFGADAAADKMSQHLAQIEGVDIEALTKAAKDRDVAKFNEQLDTLAAADPTFAKLRTGGAEALMATLANDQGSNPTGRAISSLEDLTTSSGPATSDIINQLVGRAKAEFAAGATLPPEFQSELIRSGLEQAGTAGESLDPNSAAGVRLRTLTGQAGLALQRNREQAATGFLAAADSIRNNRANILSTIIGADQNQQAGAANRAGLATQIGQSAVPKIGLTGEDVANQMVSNQKLKNDVQLARGQNAAGEQASKWAGIGSAGGSAIGGLLGGMGGGGSSGGLSVSL